jgi:hypothetical protein
VKIGGLKKRADRLAEEASSERRRYRSHADTSLVIVRRRLGSPGGLAISFSLGFMAGATGGAHKQHRKDGSEPPPRRKSFAQQLAGGPLGDRAMRLASALIAGWLTKIVDRTTNERPSRLAETTTLDAGLPVDLQH